MSEIRIIAGEWRGRRISVPPDGVRPTADRVREAWMSVVRPSLDGARVVDLCAGSGALGLEALSRGAVHCDFVEQDPAVRRTLEANLKELGAGSRATVHRGEAVAFLASAGSGSAPGGVAGAVTIGVLVGVTTPASGSSSGQGVAARWDVAFADPPYNLGVAEALAARWLATGFATIFGVEHEAMLTLPVPPDDRVADRRVYGDTAVTIYRSPPTT